MKKIFKGRIICLLVMACVMACLISCGEKEAVVTRVGSLKGPTTMGIANLISESQGDESSEYSFEIEAQADAIVGKIVQGELDIALVPANVAALLYKKTEGGVSVIDINTLGVLYFVSGDSTISSVTDLSGKTIYLMGMGTTPDLMLKYLLSVNGMTEADVTIEYKSEATEVAAMLAENPDAVGILPQPFVTAATIQNENLTVVIDATKEWEEKSADGSTLVTGVTIATKDYIEKHEEQVKAFMDAQKASVNKALDDVSGTAQIIAELGIVEKAPVAEKALPFCNITFIEGSEMKTALSGYLQAVFAIDPAFVGGELPGEDFYYLR